MADVNMEAEHSSVNDASTVEQSTITRKLTLEDFKFDVKKQTFRRYAKKTMLKLKESKDLCKFILNMEITKSRVSLANELIMDALNLSVKKLHLEFRYAVRYCGNIAEYNSKMQENMFSLPYQVFESKFLKELQASYCVINQPVSGEVIFLPLATLKLSNVTIGDDMMRNILSRCPLIEHLDITSCKGLTKISLGKMNHNLKKCSVLHNQDVLVDFFEEGLVVFPNLTLLEFDTVHLEKTFFHDSAVKFPCLAKLLLGTIYGLEVVEISIPSLKLIRVAGLMGARSVFNLPNIREFWYMGDTKTPLSHISTFSKECKTSYIEFYCQADLDRSWFLELRKFLQNVSASKKISLIFNCGGSNQVCIDKLLEEDMLGVQGPPVDELVFEDIFQHSSHSLPAFSNLVNGLLSSCRPKLIKLFNKSSRDTTRQQPGERVLPILEILGKSVSDREDWKSDLKQVTYKVKGGRPILWEDLVSLVHVQVENIQVQVRLAWHEQGQGQPFLNAEL